MIDRNARDWIALIESERAIIREADIYPRLALWAENVAPRRLLEIGCGQGVCSSRIGLKQCQYFGVDPSHVLIRRAKELFEDSHRKFSIGTASQIPANDASFDAVFSVSVWHLLADIDAAAAEIKRVLSQNGQFLIITANPDNFDLWTDYYNESNCVGKRFEGKFVIDDKVVSEDVLYLHSTKELLHSLDACGLSISRIDTFRVSHCNPELDMYIAIQGERK